MAKIKFKSRMLAGPIGKQFAIEEMELKAFSVNFQNHEDPTLTVLLESQGYPHPVTVRGLEASSLIENMREKFPGLELWFLNAIANNLQLPEGEIE